MKKLDLKIHGTDISPDQGYAHSKLTKIADKKHIPVYFSSVGLVKDPKHMFGWKTMKKDLNRKCVKSITCRDGAT